MRDLPYIYTTTEEFYKLMLMKGIPEETFVTLRYTVSAYGYGKVNMFATELHKTQP